MQHLLKQVDHTVIISSLKISFKTWRLIHLWVGFSAVMTSILWTLNWVFDKLCRGPKFCGPCLIRDVYRENSVGQALKEHQDFCSCYSKHQSAHLRWSDSILIFETGISKWLIWRVSNWIFLFGMEAKLTFLWIRSDKFMQLLAFGQALQHKLYFWPRSTNLNTDHPRKTFAICNFYFGRRIVLSCIRAFFLQWALGSVDVNNWMQRTSFRRSE